MTSVHFAGHHITIDSRFMRQRCLWCGEILVDYDLERIAVPTAQPGPPPTWPVGALVAVDGGASWVVDAEDGAPLPPNTCASSLEEDRARAALREHVRLSEGNPGPNLVEQVAARTGLPVEVVRAAGGQVEPPGSKAPTARGDRS